MVQEEEDTREHREAPGQGGCHESCCGVCGRGSSRLQGRHGPPTAPPHLLLPSPGQSSENSKMHDLSRGAEDRAAEVGELMPAYTASLGSTGWHRRLVLVFCLWIQAGSLTLFCLLSSALVCPASRGRGLHGAPSCFGTWDSARWEATGASRTDETPAWASGFPRGVRVLEAQPHFPAGFWYFSEFAGAALRFRHRGKASNC